MKRLQRTASAKRDVSSIFLYSIENFGQSVARKYLMDIDAALHKIMRNPASGKIKSQHSKRFFLYPVCKHFLAYEVVENIVFLVAVINQRRDIASILNDLETEADALVLQAIKKIKEKKPRKKHKP